VEIVADEVGPSLRFATADVLRAERRVHAEEWEPAGETPDAEHDIEVEG